MGMQSQQERELAELLVDALDLEDIRADEIVPEAPLFGFDAPGSLGLDSIDALEISLAIAQKYGVQLKADDENNRQIFSSLRALAAYIHTQF
ncbi:MAG TPA: acyl carrier protein [Chromatiales bacterium]|nr:acyl carrier protein [Chromatiales bacterium]HEX22351.1 acyl carrier protein [Chromatiales bacterium]